MRVYKCGIHQEAHTARRLHKGGYRRFFVLLLSCGVHDGDCGGAIVCISKSGAHTADKL